MADSKIGVEGVKATSEMMKVNTTLTSLNLRCEKEIKGKEEEEKKKKNG